MGVFEDQKSRTGRLIAAIGWGALALLAFAALPLHAQGTWQPERPVEIVVPSAPGSASDTTGRLLQKILQNNIVDVPVLVLNKAGGGGSLAANVLDQRPGDAHCVFNTTMSLLTNHAMGRSKVNHTDYTSLAILFGEPIAIVVRPDSPIKALSDLEKQLKRDPSSLSVAIGLAVGGTNHLAAALTAKAMSVDPRKLKTIVFQGNVHVVTALMGNHVDMAAMSVATALNASRAGRVRILGVMSERRGGGALAEIPTLKEQGYDVSLTNTRFVVGPKGLTPTQIAYWDGAFQKVVRSAEWTQTVAKNHWSDEYASSRQSRQRLDEIYRQLKRGLIAAGLASE